MTQNLLEEVGRAFGSGPVPGSLARRCASGGPLGACGRARAAHSWPGRRARRAPLRAAGCAGPERSELGEEPGPVAGALPVIGLLCCNFSRALRGACARPASLPRESLRFLGSPGGDRARLGGLSVSGGLLGSCVPGGRRLREGQPRSSGRVSAQRPRRAHVGSGRRQTTLGPWPSDKAALEGAAKLLSAFLRGTGVGSERSKVHIVFPAGRGVCLSGNWRDPSVCPGNWFPSGPPGVSACGQSVGVLQVGGGRPCPGAASMPFPLDSFSIRVGHTGSLGGTFGSHIDACG